MESKIIRKSNDLIDIKDDWIRIEKVAPWVSYFSTYRYNYEWWTQYDNDPTMELFIVLVIHNLEIVGIAPLQIVERSGRGYKYRELQFVHGGGDYSNFLIDPNVSAEPAKIVNELLGQINSHKDEYDVINLSHICQYSLLAHQILISKYNLQLKYLVECPFIDFSNFSDYDSYTKQFIPKKIKQYINRFRREVDFTMEVTSDNLVEEFGKIHIAEKDYLKSKGFEQRHSFFENERELNFRKSLYKNNRDVLTYLLVDKKTSEIICYYTGYVYRDTFHSVTTAYNPKYANLAVGKIFNYMIFEENFKNPKWQIFDMGTGRYSWKFEMTNQFNLLYQYKIEEYRNKRARVLNRIDRFLSCAYHILKGTSEDM